MSEALVNTVHGDRRRSSSVSTKQSRENLSRKHSERHQVMKIQNYVIYRKTIGAGSMGKVKLAECLTDIHKQKYAVKIMPKVDLELASKIEKSKDPKDTPEEREQRTIREMAIMRLLRHPNICQLKEYITEGDKYYMFLEYVDGGQLLDYIIKHGKLREKLARKFARQIVSALDYCHRNSIVHRDLKIENILITQSEQLKIIDFGLSNVYSPTQQLNTFCGSLYFAAPELLRARQYTGPEVDVWSFGVVLFVLVCGRVPFDDTNLPALHEKIKSGVVEDYPDHLGKDCLDLLSKIFVVDPSKRITLSAIKEHPWMNKGYEEPTRNYLPHRQPLETIDPEIVRGMHGFGLGSPEEIEDRLLRIISSSAYQKAALKIDQNYQKKANDDQSLASKPRWRRTLSTRRKTVIQDDFQSLPAMYDPLISIYYLVKERRESDERKQRLLNAEPNPLALSRSTSTLVMSKNTMHHDSSIPPAVPGGASLTRRRTFDTSKKLPDLPQPVKRAPANYLTDSQPPTPMPSISKSEQRIRRPTLMRKKSLQAAAKKLGINKLLSSNMHQDLASNADNKTSAISIPASSSSSSATTTAPSANEIHQKLSTDSDHPTKKSWLKLELNHNNTTNIKQQQRRPSTNSTSSSTHRPSWRKLSVSRHKGSARLSFDQSTGNLPTQIDPMLIQHDGAMDKISNKLEVNPVKAPIIMIPSKSERVQSSKLHKTSLSTTTATPKSLFQFNREHLFRLAPQQMMIDLLHVLSLLGIDYSTTAEQFTLSCRCDHSVWAKHPHQVEMATNHIGVLEFTIMIYEARWAGGKMGIKVKEVDDAPHLSHLYSKQVLRNVYHAIVKNLEEIAHPDVL